MSQIILDGQLFELQVLVPLTRWITVQRLRNLRPGEIIKDERVPVLLRQLSRPTFITIDHGFWDKRLCDSKYCILYFALRNDQQHELPMLLRRLLRLPEFRTRAVRMGKVAYVNPTRIEYWQIGDRRLHRLTWPEISA